MRTTLDIKTELAECVEELSDLEDEMEKTSSDHNALENRIEELKEELKAAGEHYDDPYRLFRPGQIAAAKAMGYRTDSNFVYPDKVSQ